jgi:hypothetical protein
MKEKDTATHVRTRKLRPMVAVIPRDSIVAFTAVTSSAKRAVADTLALNVKTLAV